MTHVNAYIADVEVAKQAVTEAQSTLEEAKRRLADKQAEESPEEVQAAPGVVETPEVTEEVTPEAPPKRKR